MEGRRTNEALTLRERALGKVGPTAFFYDRPNNPVAYRDLAGGAAEPRRTVVSTDRCNACHLQLSVHGGQRNETQYCVFCHAPDATDWGNAVTAAGAAPPAGRPKVASSDPARVEVAATADGVEERSIQLKHLIHRIHTGHAMFDGSAEQPGPEAAPDLPYAIYGFRTNLFLFDEVRVPEEARMRCSSCHEGETWLLESIPASALPTVSNEPTFLLLEPLQAYLGADPADPAAKPPAPIHVGVPVHDPSGGTEPKQNPMMSACVSCHTSPFALTHARAESPAPGQERCLLCHGEGQVAPVRAVHAAVAE
jgi:OmcA/MtrC family decaheme c-type cytochrome